MAILTDITTRDSGSESAKRVEHTNIAEYGPSEKSRSQFCRFWNSDFMSRAREFLGILSLITIFITCCIIAMMISTTEIFHSTVMKNLMLVNTSASFHVWKNSPVEPLLEVYIFNYTNVHDFELGKAKLQVQQLGPYTYREKAEKVNIIFHGNGTVSYQDKRTFYFVPELSNGEENDIIIAPSLTLISAVALLQNESPLSRYFTAVALRGMDFPRFMKLEANKYLWGYKDTLFTIAKNNPFNSKPLAVDKVGLLAAKHGISKDVLTIHTGEDDILNMGIISNFNGQPKLSVWGSDDCNRIDGSTGSVYPPEPLKLNQTIYVFQAELCRRFPLIASEYFTTDTGIPAVRLYPPENVFDREKTNPNNKCYCPASFKYCPPGGVFDVSPCQGDAPIMVSFPHFYLGDPVLQKYVDGLKPNSELHSTYLELHEYLGVPVGGKSRFQMNIRVRKLAGHRLLEEFEDNMVLPLAWFTLGIDKLPADLEEVLYHVTFSTRRLELVILFVMVLIAILCCTVLIQRIIKANEKIIAISPSSSFTYVFK